MLNNFTLVVVIAGKQAHALLYIPKSQPKKKYVDEVLKELSKETKKVVL